MYKDRAMLDISGWKCEIQVKVLASVHSIACNGNLVSLKFALHLWQALSQNPIEIAMHGFPY